MTIVKSEVRHSPSNGNVEPECPPAEPACLTFESPPYSVLLMFSIPKFAVGEDLRSQQEQHLPLCTALNHLICLPSLLSTKRWKVCTFEDSYDQALNVHSVRAHVYMKRPGSAMR